MKTKLSNCIVSFITLPQGDNLPKSHPTAIKVRHLVSEYLQEMVESLPDKFGPFLVYASCQLLKISFQLQDKIRSAEHIKKKDPDGPEDLFPSSTRSSNTLTAPRHIMEQPYFRERLEQVQLCGTL